MADEQLQSFLRLKQVKALTGLARSTIYDRIKRGDFPPPLAIGARAVAWTATSIADWQARQIKNSRKAAA
jgi:prophage regulatory protein